DSRVWDAGRVSMTAACVAGRGTRGHAHVTATSVMARSNARFAHPTARCPDVVAEHRGSSPGQACHGLRLVAGQCTNAGGPGASVRDRAPFPIALVRGWVFPFFLTVSS